MTKLKLHLEQNRTSLADFICASPAEVGAGLEDGQPISDRIRSAYAKLGKGETNVRVRLADLRSTLGDIPAEELNAAMLEMERDGSIVLYPLDDPQEIRPEDEKAALPNSAGFQRHILYMQI